VNKINRSKYSHHEPREMRPTVSVCVCVLSDLYLWCRGTWARDGTRMLSSLWLSIITPQQQRPHTEDNTSDEDTHQRLTLAGQ